MFQKGFSSSSSRLKFNTFFRLSPPGAGPEWTIKLSNEKCSFPPSSFNATVFTLRRVQDWKKNWEVEEEKKEAFVSLWEKDIVKLRLQLAALKGKSLSLYSHSILLCIADR